MMHLALRPITVFRLSGPGFAPVCPGLLLILLLVFAGPAVVHASGPPSVVASNKPLHSLLAGIMQGVAEPHLLMDGSTTPWRFRPDAAQRELLRRADIILWVGVELEPMLHQALQETANPRARIVEALASEELKILPARGLENRRDPFFWLDSRNMLILLDELSRLLIQVDPDNAPIYVHNRSRVLESISQIDRVMEYGYRDISGMPVFFYHDNQQYFEQAYAMKLAGTVASPPWNDSNTAAGLIGLKSWLAQAPTHCLFTEAGLPEPHLQLMLDGTGISPVELDSLGANLTPGPGLYAELMRRNFFAISGCVRTRSQSGGQAAHDPETPDVRNFAHQLVPRYLLMDHHGRSISNQEFRGSFQLIYFGYTFCPDICPTSLASAAQALQLLGQDADQVQPLFITVDPARDTPDVLHRYTGYFHPRMLGLTGSPEMIKRTAEHFKVRYEKVLPENGDPSRYSMDHSSSLILLGRHGEFLTKFAHGYPPERIAEDIREYLVR